MTNKEKTQEQYKHKYKFEKYWCFSCKCA